MKTNEFIANRLREVFLDGTWIAFTNWKDQLSKTTWKESTQKIGELNTIAALTYHVNYYLAGLIKLFDGGPLEIQDKYSFDHPPIDSEKDWQMLVDEFLVNSNRFCEQVANLDEATIQAPFIVPKYGSNIRNLEGVIEHGYYHLGQVVLIRKLLLQSA